MKNFILLLFSLLSGALVFGQVDSIRLDSIEKRIEIVPAPIASPSKEVYKLNLPVDLPLTAIGTGWSLYAFTKIYSKDTSTTAQILELDRNDITPFNRGAIDHFSEKAQNAGDMFFYGSMPLPLILLIDKKIRNDAGKVGFLFLESMSVTGILYTGAVYFHDKYRPYAYNPEVEMGKRKSGGAKNSFFAGHVALVGTSTFFMAKTFSDYHPEFRAKWLLYGIAGAATATTGYLRYRGGQHFPTDILIGTAVGPLSGLLVPHFHKMKDKDPRLSLVPFYGKEKGVAMTWKFGYRKG